MEALDQVLKAEEEARKIREDARVRAKRISDNAHSACKTLYAEAEDAAKRENEKAREEFEREVRESERNALGTGELKSAALQKDADARIKSAADALLEELCALAEN